MYSWTLTACEANYNLFIDQMRDLREVAPEWVPTLRAWLSKCKMRAHLRRLVELMIDAVHREPTNQKAISCAVEFFAGCKYAHDDATVGKMKHIQSLFSGEKSIEAIKYLGAFCKESLKNRALHDPKLWFELRARCMDAYSLCHILNSSKDYIIYYAGMAHTQNVADYLLQTKLAEVVPNDRDDICAGVCQLCQHSDILHIQCVKLSHRTLILVGENHSRTKLSFANGIIEFLQEQCDNNTSLLFLIEKHISNDKDDLQKKLMCEQDLAIHKSRCHPFMQQNECEHLEILAVDNRHADMGFLRVEMLDLADSDEAFTKAVHDFNLSCIESMKVFCETLLKCHDFRHAAKTRCFAAESCTSAYYPE